MELSGQEHTLNHRNTAVSLLNDDYLKPLLWTAIPSFKCAGLLLSESQVPVS